MAVTASPDQVYRMVATVVDAGFYRTVYADRPDVDLDPVAHYVNDGWREGLDPAPWFSTEDYLARNPELAGTGVNPLYHYLTVGRGERREIRRSEQAAAYVRERLAEGGELDWSFQVGSPPPPRTLRRPVPPQRITPADRELAAVAFDAGFYLSSNADVAGSGLDPLDHFLRHGWLEGRDPSPGFSVADYLEAYPDVADAGLNPFVHYLRSGKAEGRLPRSPLGFRHQVLSRQTPMEERLEAVRRAQGSVRVGTAEGLAQGLSTGRSSEGALHLTFSHDDYTANLGGVQLCLQREGAKAEALGLDHLHIFPAKAWPIVRQAGESAPLGVVWNGQALGAYAARTIVEVLQGRAAGTGPRSFAIHNLLGHAAEEVIGIVRALGMGEGFFWIHDFASLCAGYHLLRNDVADCDAPAPDSAACGICLYGPWRARHLTAHEALFEALDLTAVAPSEAALATWRKGWGFKAKAHLVHPNAQLIARQGRTVPAHEGPFRFAFLGLPMPLKGWPIFKDLATRHAGDPRYEFWHLGQQPQAGLAAKFHPVRVSPQSPTAMQDALEALAIDAVLIWPLCQETFSFTAYEAIAAGAAILTGPDTGNVAAFVNATGQGEVLTSEHHLAQLFQDGEVLRLGRAHRKPTTQDIRHSALTMDLAYPGAAA